MNISICICTRKREDGLKRLLNSLSEMLIPEGVEIKIVIVENDSSNFSEAAVREFSDGGKLNIKYCVETKQGLVYARNRSVAEAGDCDFCCFTDDDEVVAKDWIIELVKCQREFEADGVAGPTMPSFSIELPVSISDFHKPKSYPYGTIVESAFTGNLLVRKGSLDSLTGPFETKLNFSGGEDSYLTKQISSLGGVIRFNPNALAYETIPDKRATVGYMVKRKYRTANTELLIRSITDKNFNKLRVSMRLIMRFLNGLLIFIPCYFSGGVKKYNGLVKMANAVGGFAFIFGKSSEFYK